MCLAFMAERYCRIEFLGESVFLDAREDGLEVKEIYDVFFQLGEAWPNPRIRCISPQNLLSEEGLAVEAIDVPGVTPEDSIIYNYGAGLGSTYDAPKHSFSIRVLVADNLDDPTLRTEETISGRVLQPRFEIPSNLTQDPLCKAILAESGTVFDVALDDLVAGVMYAVRLVVKPHHLIGSPERFPCGRLEPGLPITVWCQDLSIYCPRTAVRNFAQYVRRAEKDSTFAQAAARIRTVVEDDQLHILPVNNHRLMVVSPVGGQIARDDCPGAVLAGPMVSLLDDAKPDYRRIAEWSGGCQTYWQDDIESFARGIWAYVSEFAAADGKTKEEVTAAISAQHHGNCSMLMDALASRGALKKEGLAYRASPLPDEEGIRKVTYKIATDSRVKEAFSWVGFKIRCSLTYTYMGVVAVRKVRWYQFKLTTAWWIAIISLIVSTASVLITLFWSPKEGSGGTHPAISQLQEEQERIQRVEESAFEPENAQDNPMREEVENNE